MALVSEGGRGEAEGLPARRSLVSTVLMFLLREFKAKTAPPLRVVAKRMSEDIVAVTLRTQGFTVELGRTGLARCLPAGGVLDT